MAYLVIENGALQGQQFQIPDEAPLVIGRHSGCDIVLPIPGVSRRHCQLSQVNTTYVVEDLKSRNGIYLNGNPVTNSPLSHNDVLHVSRFILRFFDPAAAKRSPGRLTGVGSVVFDDSPGLGESMSIDATCYPGLTESKVLDGRGATPVPVVQDNKIIAELQRRLDIFYQVAQSLSSTTEEDKLLGEILDCLLEIYPSSDRVFATTGTTLANLELRAVRHREEGHKTKQLRLSRSVITEVLERREALLISDLASDDVYAAAESIISQNISSIMCVPLISHGEIYGIIQIENNTRSDSFNGEDLNLLVGIAVQAALFLRNSKLLHQVAVETSRRSHLQRFFSPAVADQVMNNNVQLGGQLREGCIMFCDIVGYTARSANVDAAEIIRDLNKYFGIMIGIIMTEKGTVDKFGGDAIMAVWGAPLAISHDARYAISCSLQMQNAVVRFNQELSRSGAPTIAMGIGLHFGEFVAGNIGSEARMEYTVIGENVNMAARVESKTAGDMLLVTDSMIERASAEFLLGMTFESIPLKGVPGKAALTSIRGLRTEDGYVLSIPASIGEKSGKITFYDPPNRSFKFVCGHDLPEGDAQLVLDAPEFTQVPYPVNVTDSGEASFHSFTFKSVPEELLNMFRDGIVKCGTEIDWERGS
jgi:adenylate cyclase